MKILNIHRNIKNEDLLDLLNQKLNPLFEQQRQSDLEFTCEIKDCFIEISQPDLYDEFLFRIEIKGPELFITRSEHYVDDVNSLTIESILNNLLEELAGEQGITFILEG